MQSTRKSIIRFLALMLAMLLTMGMAFTFALAVSAAPAETIATLESIPDNTTDNNNMSNGNDAEMVSPDPVEEDHISTTDPLSETTADEVSPTLPTEEENITATPAVTPPDNIPNSPIRLETTAEYYDDYFALLHASQGDVQYHILTKDAFFESPTINAYTFIVEPDLEAVGFEIRLDGVQFKDDPVINPGAEVMINVSDLFTDATADEIGIFDIKSESWLPLTLDRFTKDGNTSTITFYTPTINSRFAIVRRTSNASMYDSYYGSSLGESVYMSVNNKSAWCVYGKNSYGFGNRSTGTFDIHLVSRSSRDSGGKTVGYSDYTAAACLEYWKAAPRISEGQIVNANYGGYIGGWSDLSVAQRSEIVGYILYGVRYLSDYSFDNKLGPATIYSRNPIVNMAYAQQILVWSVVKGIDPNSALNKYSNDVPYYGRKIMQLAQQNPENYDYAETLVVVGEGGSKQDLAIILEPKKQKPPAGEIIVNKSVTGSNQLAGWKMELYSSYSAAQAGRYPIATATTNSYGTARFPDTLNGTYYLREAVASKQNGDLSYWTLSNSILTVTVNSNTVNAGTIYNSYTPTKSYGLRKVPDCSNTVAKQFEGNPMYSLAGAKYEVTLNGKLQEILTTNSRGYANGTKTYPVGTKLVLREIQAPSGYKIDSSIHNLMITAGDNIIEVRDIPLMDPPFSITKVDKGASAPQGNTSFESAVFKWEYFRNTNWSGTPDRTWYFSTNSSGIADYKTGSLAAGYTSDPLFVDDSGDPSLPLGSLKMTEVKNPLGYLVLPKPLLCKIIEDSSANGGVTHVFEKESLEFIKDLGSGNIGIYESINTELFGSIQVDKIDSDTGSVPQGDANLAAHFQVINKSSKAVKIGNFNVAAPGEVCFEFQTDAQGHYSSGKIFPIGSYIVSEKAAPSGYDLNADWTQAFEVTEDHNSFSFTSANGSACPDKLIYPGEFSMDKLDLETGSEPQGDATLSGAEFQLINKSKHPIMWENHSVAPDEVLMTFRSDENGHYHYKGLPVGQYCIQEIKAPEGYLVDLIWQYDFSITDTNRNVVVNPDMTCQDQPIKGGLRVIKLDSIAGEETTKEHPLSGITFSLSNESQHSVVIAGKTYKPGEVISHLEVAWDGTHWSAETGKNLPYGTYGVWEDEKHDGLANEHYKVNPEKHLVEIRDGDTIVEIKHTNEMNKGKIIIHKINPILQPLAGASFTLECSTDDGTTWTPVADSSRTTDADGVAEWDQLRTDYLYRVIETKAPDGYTLLTDSAFIGRFKTGKIDPSITIRVVNSPTFLLPKTGGHGFIRIPIAIAICGLISLTAFVYIKKKEH